jgi:hypothetical protein
MPIISGKSLGRKKPLFEDFSIPLPALGESTGEATLRWLIEQIVRGEVAAFRERQSERRLIRALTERQIDAAAAQGKISSGGAEFDAQPVDDEEAVAAAIQAFEDGLYFVVIDELQYRSVEDHVPLKPDSRITFIRLTLLAGG